MSNPRPILFVVAVVSLLATPLLAPSLAPSLAHAQSAEPAPGLGAENPKELFEGATRMAMKALELLIKTLPQYDPPVVLENGDILIRRKNPKDAAPQPDDGSGSKAERI